MKKNTKTQKAIATATRTVRQAKGWRKHQPQEMPTEGIADQKRKERELQPKQQ